MDFALTEEQQELVDLARADPRRPLHARAPEGGRGRRRLVRPRHWAELAKADLLGIALPEAVGGGGFGFLEACLLLEDRAGPSRRCRCCPRSSPRSPIAEFGTDAQQRRLAARRRRRRDGAHRARSAELGAGPRARSRGAAPTATAGARRARRRPCRRRTSPARCSCRPATDGDVAAVPRADRRAPGSRSSARTPSTTSRSSHVELRRRAWSAPTPSSAGIGVDDGQAPIDWIVDRATVGLCAIGRRRRRGGHAHHRRLHRSSASSSTGPSARSRPSASAWPTATSTTRRSSSRMLQAATQLAEAGADGRQGGRDREVLGVRRRQPGRPRRPARARRHLHRPRLPDPPLLPVVEADRVPARRRPARSWPASAPSSPTTPSPPDADADLARHSMPTPASVTSGDRFAGPWDSLRVQSSGHLS